MVNANITLCQIHLVYLHEDVVQIMHAPLEASACNQIQRSVRLYSRFVFD